MDARDDRGSRPPKPHEDRQLGVLRVVLGDAVAHEVSIPRGAARIDAVWQLADVDGTLGPLAPHVANRTVAIETWSGDAPRGAIADALFKGAWVARQVLRARRARRPGAKIAEPPSGRPPLVLVFATGRAVATSSTTSLREIFPGIRHLDADGELELIVVERSRLPLETGTTALHLIPTPSDHGGAAAVLAFLDDPAVSTEAKARLQDAIMNQTIPTTTEERMTVRERIEAEAMAIGEKRGERRGEKRGERRALDHAREQLLAQVAGILGDEARLELAEVQDFDTLCARAAAMLAGRR